MSKRTILLGAHSADVRNRLRAFNLTPASVWTVEAGWWSYIVDEYRRAEDKEARQALRAVAFYMGQAVSNGQA